MTLYYVKCNVSSIPKQEKRGREFNAICQIIFPKLKIFWLFITNILIVLRIPRIHVYHAHNYKVVTYNENRH